ncbi:hypothetical protein OSTOST_01829, partial [Ostertagia ostertagi]
MGSSSKRISSTFQRAMNLIRERNWEGPWEKPRRLQTIFVPKSLENILKWLPVDIKGVVYGKNSMPPPDDKSDVLVVVGKEFSDRDTALYLLRPWLERIRSLDVSLAMGMAPREQNTESNIRLWGQTAANVSAILRSVAQFLEDDAPAEEWDNPIRCLGSDPYDNHDMVGRFKARIFYEKVRKYWVPSWPEPQVEAEDKKSSRKRSINDSEKQVYGGMRPKRGRFVRHPDHHYDTPRGPLGSRVQFAYWTTPESSPAAKYSDRHYRRPVRWILPQQAK